jgi:protein SCO1
VFIYTITMDPVNDTPEMLNIHASAFEAGNGWLFLTGKPEDVERIRFQLGERSRKLSEHRNDLVMGNEKTGDWSRSSLFADLEVIVAGVRELDPVWRTAERKPQTDYVKAGNLRLSNTPGEALFLKACSTCHTIGHGTLVGPDLKNVAARRDRDWLTRFMMAPGRMRAQKDPLTMELMEKFKGVRMPDLGLQETDVSDLLTYIGAQSGKQDSAEPRATGKTPQAAGPSG